MRDVLENVMLLQPSWTARNTEDMELRGYLVRTDGPNWLRDRLPTITKGVDPAINDFGAEGRDGTGLKTEIPWFRLFSVSRSPKARFGFYVVYLFDRPGDSVYVSLNQGTTRWEDGDFKALDPDLLASRVKWARSVIAATGLGTTGLLPDIDLQANGPLGAGYERGNVWAIRYPREDLPDSETILSNLGHMAQLLSAVYVAQDLGQMPGELPVEVRDAEDAVADHAGKVHREMVAGFRPNAKQRRAIELRAMEVADAHLRADHWSTEDVSARRPFDLLATKDGEELHVEVKGTTSLGETVLLTRGEVEHHASDAPASMLIVLHSIELGGTEDAPTASGGELLRVYPWKIEPADLRVLGFSYAVPPAV